MLCDLLHKLPSEVEAESEEKVIQLLIYFNAKALYEKRQKARAEAEAELRRIGG